MVSVSYSERNRMWPDTAAWALTGFNPLVVSASKPMTSVPPYWGSSAAAGASVSSASGADAVSSVVPASCSPSSSVLGAGASSSPSPLGAGASSSPSPEGASGAEVASAATPLPAASSSFPPPQAEATSARAQNRASHRHRACFETRQSSAMIRTPHVERSHQVIAAGENALPSCRPTRSQPRRPGLGRSWGALLPRGS